MVCLRAFPFHSRGERLNSPPEQRLKGDFAIPPPYPRRPQTPPQFTGPRYNQFIQSQKVRVIDENGENLGVMFTREAFEQAQEVGLDLVEISPGADPPVAKFLDIGRYKYEAQKKANEQRKKQKTQEIKEIKMRPNIDDHDYDTKMKKVVEFLEDGDKVKLTMRFRGREMAHGQLGMAVLQRASEQVSDIAKIEAHPRMEGRQMLMVLSPK
jgi:translation initiation factor IF-3